MVARSSDGVVLGGRRGPEQQLELADVAAPGGQQRMPGTVSVGSLPRRRTSGASSASRSHSTGEGCSSSRCTSRRSASAREDLQVGGGQAGQAEQAQPSGQVDEIGLGAQARARPLGARGGMRDADEPLAQQVPQLRLPHEVGRERATVLVDRITLAPMR